MQATSNQIKGSYVGWVPCLTGQLVFNLVECGLQDKDRRKIEIIHYCIDKDEKLAEHILVHSAVNWKDFGDSNLNGLWSVVLLSKRNLENKYHEGAVYILHHALTQSDTELNNAFEAAHAISYRLKTEEFVDVKNFSEFKAELDNACLNKQDCYKVNFNLEEDGIVWLDPFNQGLSENGCKIIARQAYYYIKYTWHRHQHHDSRAETLTTVHMAASDIDKKEFPKKLIEDLKRNLVVFKRGIDNSSHRKVLKAKGIVSYAKALVEIMKSRDFINMDFYKKELNHLKYFEESLDVISNGIEKDISMHNQAVNDARALVLFIFAIITPALVINRESISKIYGSYPTPSYIKLIGDLFSNGASFAYLISIISIFFTIYILLQTRFGNFLILMGCIKKAVATIVSDRRMDDIFSKSNLIAAGVVVMAVLALTISIIGLSPTASR